MKFFKKILAVIILAALIITQAPPVFSSPGEQLIAERVGLAYWDIWVHADGITWQWTGAPGQEKSYIFSPAPPDTAGFTNVRLEMQIGVTQEQFISAGGRPGYAPDATGWESFWDEVLLHTPQNYRKTGDLRVTFTLAEEDDAKEITKEEQAELVRGLRWYLPVFYRWYGVRGSLPDFEVVTLSSGTAETEPGKAYTGSVTYRLKNTATSPVEAILTLTHNGFPLRTPGGELINRTITFNPGQSQTFQFNWTGQESDSLIRAEIQPTQPANEPQERRDANPADNVRQITVPRKQLLPLLPPGGNPCSLPPPMGINEPAPISDSSTRYIFTHSTYEIESIALCVNVDSPEVIRNDTVNGRFQYVSYQRDHYDIEVYTMIDPGCGGWSDKFGGGCPGWPPSFAWLPGGTMSHRYMINMPFTIRSNVGGTVISPASGQQAQGRHNFTWRTTGITATMLNSFTLTVTDPSGRGWTATDACTVFLPRGLSLSEITMRDPNNRLYRGSRQTVFVRVTNTRDVGEERVTLVFRAGGQTVKTETFILPSGPTGTNKAVLRAFEFATGVIGPFALSVTATAPALPGADTPDRRRVLSDDATRTLPVDKPGAIDVPVMQQRDRREQRLDTVYHHTTTAQNREHVNSIMPEINYNSYAWAARTERYSESLEFDLEIDSWQARPKGHPRPGRGTWEIVPLFGDQAHRTVRAGTGFELIINTDYQTDFGTRPPNSRVATAVNAATYTSASMNLDIDPMGIDRVWGAFPYANYIKSVAPQNHRDYIVGKRGLAHGKMTMLDATKGWPGERKVKWEYPEHVHVGETKTFRSRTHLIDKFYTDSYPKKYDARIIEYFRMNNADVPAKATHDDRYRFFAVAEVAGVSNLLAVQEDYVFVFGHFFRDIYMSRPREIAPEFRR